MWTHYWSNSMVFSEYLKYKPLNDQGALSLTLTDLTMDVDAVRYGSYYSLHPFEVTYDQLNSQYAIVNNMIYELLIKDQNGELHTEYLRKSGDRISDGRYLCGVRAIVFEVKGDTSGGGGTASSTSLSYTGSGTLGGSGAGSLTNGTTLSSSYFTIVTTSSGDPGTTGSGDQSGTTGSGDQTGTTDSGDQTGTTDSGDQTDPSGNGNPTDPETPAGENAETPTGTETLTVVVERKTDGEDQKDSATQEDADDGAIPENRSETFSLRLFEGDREIRTLEGGTVHVSMDWQMPASWNPESVFAVFRDDSGELHAFRATWDQATGRLVFDSDMLGDFVLVWMDWDGVLFSDDFYAALEFAIRGRAPAFPV